MSTPTDAHSSDAAAPGAPAPVRGLWGTQIRAIDLLAIGIVSTAIFVFWGGALWSVPRGAAHVGRFAWSYALVVPLVVLAHVIRTRSWTDWGSMGASAFIVWSAKFLLTVPLYHLLAPGVTAQYHPSRADDAGDVAVTSGYSVVPAFAGATLTGRVVDAAGQPVAGAVVAILGVDRGAPPPAAATHSLRIEGGALRGGPIVANVGDELRVSGVDAERYLVRGNIDDHQAFARAVPHGSEPSVILRERGLVHLACDAQRPCGRTWAHVAADPYHGVTAADGTFEIAHVPPGEHEILIAGADRTAHARAAAGATAATLVLR